MPRDVLSSDEAQRLLDNQLLMKLFNDIVEDSLYQIDNDNLDDYQYSNANRDRMFIKIQVVNEIRKKLSNIVLSSKLNEREQ